MLTVKRYFTTSLCSFLSDARYERSIHPEWFFMPPSDVKNEISQKSTSETATSACCLLMVRCCRSKTLQENEFINSLCTRDWRWAASEVRIQYQRCLEQNEWINIMAWHQVLIQLQAIQRKFTIIWMVDF